MADSYRALMSGPYNKPFFLGPRGRAWFGELGQLLDERLDALYQARRSRFPDYAPSDALFYLASERQLEQVPGEAEADFRARIKGVWPIWAQAGTQRGHVDEFGWSGLRNVRVVRRHEWSTPAPVGSLYVQAFARLVWSQFDVLVQQPHPWTQRLWGSPPAWGSGTWGSSMSLAEVAFFTRQARTFKSGHDTLTYLHVNFSQGRVWGAYAWGDGGVWGGTGQVMTIVIGEAHWLQRGLL